MDNHIYNLELFIAKLLRYGVIFAGLLLGIGWALQVHVPGNPLASFATYQPLSMTDSIHVILQQHQWGLLTCYIGLVALILLPFLRVMMTAFLFFKQKEFILALFATFVCACLILSVLLGFDT